MSLKPILGVSILLHDKNKVLLIKRGKTPYKGHWSLPGGSQKFGETIKQAAHRELTEETNLTAKTLRFTNIRDLISHDNNGKIKFHYVLSTFATNEFYGMPKAKDDADDIGWYTFEEIKSLLTTPNTPEFILKTLQTFNGNKTTYDNLEEAL